MVQPIPTYAFLNFDLANQSRPTKCGFNSIWHWLDDTCQSDYKWIDRTPTRSGSWGVRLSYLQGLVNQLENSSRLSKQFHTTSRNCKIKLIAILDQMIDQDDEYLSYHCSNCSGVFILKMVLHMYHNNISKLNSKR